MHGAFLKAWGSHFGAHRHDIDRGSDWRAFALGTGALSLVLGAVWYARASYLADSIREAAIIGGEAPSWIGVVGGSLVTNMIVWIAGVILSWYAHDRDPSFPRAARDRDRLEQRYRKAQERLLAPLRRTFEQIDAEAEQKIQEARGQDASLQRFDRYQVARRAFERVAAKDAEVLGALEFYRGELVRQASDRKLLFEAPRKLTRHQIETFTPVDYAATHLRLKYL